MVVRIRLGSALTVPIRSWLVEESDQRGKLWVARQWMDSIQGNAKGVRWLIDAGFMRSTLILPLLELQVRIIGQVRSDTALFLPPEAESRNVEDASASTAGGSMLRCAKPCRYRKWN
ncbi:MAG: hypothetical protein AW06_003372 [Candidatus Accumulibacter cognatus]|uniref:Uncharacterized protein n=1 Tax=Candidatus Accumulibacter cognatus TaxID=2954383 RepID=A0A080M4X3_9PROT|nr:MAG: hypothetical protein AW06_003372 [Candidatus Accumulibacter cognatus]